MIQFLKYKDESKYNEWTRGCVISRWGENLTVEFWRPEGEYIHNLPTENVLKLSKDTSWNHWRKWQKRILYTQEEFDELFEPSVK